MKDTLNSSREGTLVNSENQRGDIEMRNFLETSPLKVGNDPFVPLLEKYF